MIGGAAFLGRRPGGSRGREETPVTPQHGFCPGDLVELPSGERWTVSPRTPGPGADTGQVPLLRTEPRPGGRSRVAAAGARARDVRLVRPVGERPAGKGTDADLALPVTPPTEFTPADKPRVYEWMPPRRCFRNAFTLVTASSELLYGEGYARLPQGEGTAWVHHAWVIDRDYCAVDVTWRVPGSRYVGIAVHPEQLRDRHFRKRGQRLVEPVLAAVLPFVEDLSAATWQLADWFADGQGQELDAGRLARRFAVNVGRISALAMIT